MKLSVQEEYGLRCLLRIARFYELGKALTIPEISRGEGLTQHTTAKILRTLRLGGFIESARGQLGGYVLSRSPDEIFINNVITKLGGKLYDDSFCASHTKGDIFCTVNSECSIRSLWIAIQTAVDNTLKGLRLSDLLGNQQHSNIQPNITVR